MNMILHGNDDADIRKGDTITSPQFTNGDAAADVRLRRRQSAVLGQVVEQRPGERLRPLRVRPAAGEERRLRLPAAHPQVAQEHRQGRGHPAARRAVPRQRRGRHPQAAAQARLHQGHHRPARRTSSTAPASRPASSCSTRRTPQARTGVFMIDASKGFMKDGPRTGCAARTSTRSSTSSTSRPRSSATRAWCRSPRSPSRRTTTTSTSRATSTPPSPRTSRTSTPTCTAASPTATSTRSSGYWDAFPQPARHAVHSRTGPATATSPSTSPRCSRPSSTPPSSRSSPTEVDAQVGEWFDDAPRRAGRRSTQTPGPTT